MVFLVMLMYHVSPYTLGPQSYSGFVTCWPPAAAFSSHTSRVPLGTPEKVVYGRLFLSACVFVCRYYNSWSSSWLSLPPPHKHVSHSYCHFDHRHAVCSHFSKYYYVAVPVLQGSCCPVWVLQQICWIWILLAHVGLYRLIKSSST